MTQFCFLWLLFFVRRVRHNHHARPTPIMAIATEATKQEMFKKLVDSELKNEPKGMLKAVKSSECLALLDLDKEMEKIDTCSNRQLSGNVLRLVLVVLMQEFDPEDSTSTEPGVISRRLRARFPSALNAAKQRRKTLLKLYDLAHTVKAKQRELLTEALARVEKKELKIARRIEALKRELERLKCKKLEIKSCGETRVHTSIVECAKTIRRYDMFSRNKMTMGHGYASWARLTRQSQQPVRN